MTVDRDRLSPVSSPKSGDALAPFLVPARCLTLIAGGRQWRMADEGATAWNRKFCKRVQQVRERRGMTQAEIAEALGVKTEAYKKWESRSPMPQRYIKRFCLICAATIEELFDVEKAMARPKPVKAA